MVDKSRRNIKKIKGKRRTRGTPMFDKPIEIKEDKNKLIKEPESNMDVARLLADEIIKKWPDATTPTNVSGKHTKLSNDIINEFDGQTVLSMIRILVWDFEEIRKNKSFFPPSSHLNWPWIDQLYNYRHALASSVGTGITDSTSRTSAYAQRYLSAKPENIESSDKTTQESMKDIAKKLLGQ